MIDSEVATTRIGGPLVGPAPLWAETLEPAERAALDPGTPDELDRRPDVLVVGGGVIGLATAVFCRRLGRAAACRPPGGRWPPGRPTGTAPVKVGGLWLARFGARSPRAEPAFRSL